MIQTLLPRAACTLLATILAAGPIAAAAGSTNPADTSDVIITQAHIDKAVASLDGIAADLMRKTGVPGMAIAVVERGKIVYAKGFGVRDVSTKKPVDPHTVFQIASVSKSIASTVVAGAVGRGVVKWSDPVSKYIPGFTLNDPYVGSHVTIADMFAHRSGLPDHAADNLEDLGYTRSQILEKLAFEPLQHWRVTYNYTNFGLTSAAQAVATAENTSWEQLSHDILYAPLGMTSTSSRYDDFLREPNRASLHVRTSSGWQVSSRDPDPQSPAGGVSSNVLDLAKWMILQIDNGAYGGRQLIAKNPLLATHLPHIMAGPLASPLSRANFYGYGMNVNYDEAGRLHLSHSGAFAKGAATAYELLPSAKLGIMVLTNGIPLGVPESITKMFYDIVEFGSVQIDWFAVYSPVFVQMLAPNGKLAGKTPPTQAVASQPLSSYVGTYANDYYGPATIAANAATLTMTYGAKPFVVTLKHWSGNTFAFVPSGENTSGISAVTFDGSKMTIEYLNENGLGTFTRA